MSEQEEWLYNDDGELVGFRHGSIYYGPAEKIKMLEADLHCLRSRNEGMEAALGELRCDLINAKLSIRDMRVLGETTKTRTELDVDEQRIDMKIRKIDRALASPDSEPAEGPRDAGVGPPEERVAALNKPAEGADHSSRDFEGTDPRGMGPLPGEPGNPNPSFEQMERQDAMLERREALEVVRRYLDAIADLERVTRQGGAEPEDLYDLEWAVQTAVQHADDAIDELSRTSDEGGVAEALDDAITRCTNISLSSGQWEEVRQLYIIARRTLSAGVPKAVRRAARNLRDDLNLHTNETLRSWVQKHVDELDRALAEQGEKRVPEACVVAEDHPVGNDAVYVADTCIARGDWFAMTTLRDQINRAFRAAAPQSEHSQPDSGESSDG